MTSLAEQIATSAHQGQVRKYTGEPYIEHPARMVDFLKTCPLMHLEPVRLADTAWLHDVLEDTEVNASDLLRMGIDPETVKAVEHLTWKKLEGETRAEKALRICKQLRAERDPVVLCVKVADINDNLRNIESCAPSFAKVYVEEKVVALQAIFLAMRNLKLEGIAYRTLLRWIGPVTMTAVKAHRRIHSPGTPIGVPLPHPLVGTRVLNVHRQSCDYLYEYRKGWHGTITHVLEGCNPLLKVLFDCRTEPIWMCLADLAYADKYPGPDSRIERSLVDPTCRTESYMP
jgi:hypothetical protein